MKTIQKKSQFGRSMTEMLGVLAIIGVLSVAAVSGYRTAITRHQANEIIEDVKMAGFIVADSMFKSLPDDDEGISLDDKFAKKTSYPFRVFTESEVTFEIMVQNVSERVCEELKSRKVDWLEEIKANGKPTGSEGDNLCRETNDNEMSFFFNTELNGQQTDFFGACKEDAECGECGKCNGRKCEYETGELKTSAGKCVPCTDSKTSSTTTQQAPPVISHV